MSSLELKNITKTFRQGINEFKILDNSSLKIDSGEICCLIGPSGCGKSTLLQIAGLLDYPDSGQIFIDNKLCNNLNEKEITLLRGRSIGFIYQFHHLLGEFSALENVMMPLLIAGIEKAQAKEKAKNILTSFSLENRFNNIPSELSGGEQQRVAIARSLVHDPKILLADEPTGNLDPVNSNFVFNEFIKHAREKNLSVLIVTHNLELAKKGDRILTIKNGKIEPYKV